jgi:phosphomannomutase/phosphoglucomutase
MRMRVNSYGPKVTVYRTIPSNRNEKNFDGSLVGFFHREYDGRANIWPIGNKPPTINLAGIRSLGQATGTQLQVDLETNLAFVVRDYRPYSEEVQDAFMKGLLSTGMDLIDLGMGITPEALFAYYHLSKQTDLKLGGVMITGSHNPNGWTGIKVIFGPSQTFGPFELQRNERILRGGYYLTGQGSYQLYNGMREAYLDDLASRPLSAPKPLKIVVSTFNSGAGLFLPEVLKRAGYEVIEVYTDLDWSFPNGNPNPENHDNLKKLGNAVQEHNADIGISTDGDGDRFGVVDETGREIYSDRAAMVIVDGIFNTLGDKPRVVIDLKSTGAWERWPKFISAGGEAIVVPTGHYYTKFGAKKFGVGHWCERS